ncbi:DUF6998 domain-containing protein [Empedobacter tilapiae]
MKSLNVPNELKVFSEILKKLKKDHIIKTNNLVGDLGEYFCKELFQINLNESTVEKGFDGYDHNKLKVEIKTRRTPKGNSKVIFKNFQFDYCLFVELNDCFEPIHIYKIYKEDLLNNLDKKGDRLSVSKIKKTKHLLVYKHSI